MITLYNHSLKVDFDVESLQDFVLPLIKHKNVIIRKYIQQHLYLLCKDSPLIMDALFELMWRIFQQTN